MEEEYLSTCTALGPSALPATPKAQVCVQKAVLLEVTQSLKQTS